MTTAGALTASVGAGLVAQAGQNAGTSATLLKKAMWEDENLVAILLPPPPANTGSVNIPA